MEHEVKLDRDQEFAAVSKSPTKRKKYETGKDMEKVSYASDSTTDLKSNVLPEDSSLALRIDRKNEELCTAEVSRCFQTQSEPTTSPVRTKDFADTPTKADVPSAQNLTPNRNKSTKHRPKKFFDVEGHDWRSESPNKPVVHSELDSDFSHSSPVIKKRGRKKNQIMSSQ